MAEKMGGPLKMVYGEDLRLDDYGEVILEGNATGKSSPKAGPSQ